MTATSFGSLGDLRQMLRAIQADERRAPSPVAPATDRWRPAVGEQVVLVCGCGGAPGATTMALALATVAGRARVVETCGGTNSGLVYAASAELGTTDRGWLRGSRDGVLIERRASTISVPEQLPTPARPNSPLTIIDSSWDVDTLLGLPGWLGELARSVDPLVLVARATIPGLRQLEAAVALVRETRVFAVSVGARRWLRPVEQSAGRAVRQLRAEGRIFHVPHVPQLGITGLTPDPLPPSILRPARTLLTLLEGRQS